MLVELAAALDGPQAATGQALRAGSISAEQAWAIVRTIRALPAGAPAAMVGEAEAFLLAQAEVFDPAELARLGAFLITQLADQDPEPGQEKDPADVRELWLTDTGAGTTRIRGTLDAEAAAMLRAALDPLAAPRPTSGTSGADDDGAATIGDGSVGGAGGDEPRDTRSAARRRADALVELIARALDTGTLPAQGGQRPHIAVLAPLSAFLGEPGAAPAQTSWGLPLPAAVLARLRCDAEITRVLLGPAGVPLDVGRSQRIVPPGLRRALAVRDRCCSFPGCDRPSGWCEAHHVIEWSQGGRTALDNLTLVCGRHHRLSHHSDWEIQFGGDGIPEWIPPGWIDPARTPRRNPFRRTIHDTWGGHGKRDGPGEDPFMDTLGSKS